MNYDICIVGGAGHVGAPLSVVLANAGYSTLIYDVNESSIASILSGRFPFLEEGGNELLAKVISAGRLFGSTSKMGISSSRAVIVTIGTPVDEFQNPVWDAVTACIDSLLPEITNADLIILRSTVAPGTTDRLQQHLERNGLKIPVAFCPERVVQGRAIKEVQQVPQIVSGTSKEAIERATDIFSKITKRLIHIKPIEAEYSKLFCNAYRYIQFAATNQFYMMAKAAGCDYQQVLEGIRNDYPRMNDFPGPGFAAGPCLLKDTLQLAASSNYRFELGHAAIHINEGLPAFVVDELRRDYALRSMTVGILGMAFKAQIDDPRSSLSYKLKKLLRLHARKVLTTDPYVKGDPDLCSVETVIAESDLLIAATPHREYAGIDTLGKPCYDMWKITA
jgi:UDP-N-acetyl-D-mannosaminuronic acid dehydrogenase